MAKKIYHEVKMSELEGFPYTTPAEINEHLFKMYIQIATFAGHKILGLVCGRETAKLLQQLPGDPLKQLQEDDFYKMGYHGTIPIYVDNSMGTCDILVVCKSAIEKIRLVAHE